MRHKPLIRFRLMRLVADVLTVPVAFVIAYCLKFKLGLLAHFFSLPGYIYEQAQIEPYLNVMGLILCLWIPIFYLSGMYRPAKGLMPEVNEILSIVKGTTLATIMTMALSFLVKSFPESRYVVFYAWIVTMVMLGTLRLIIHKWELKAIQNSIDAAKLVVIGAQDMAQDIIERVLLYPSLGYTYIGNICTQRPETMHYHLEHVFIDLGRPKDYAQILLSAKPDIVIVTDETDLSISDLQTYCIAHGILLKKVSSDVSWLTSLATFEDFDGIPLIQYSQSEYPLIERVGKRILDYSLSLLGLLVLSPVLLITMAVIKWVSPDGPIFYKQDRVGEHGRVFAMLKFRTMHPNAESKSGPIMVSKSDARYIRCGRFLRKTSIDELPQLLNVLRGDMSLVGPRPERPFFVDAFSKEIPHFSLRHTVKGGLTGWAQINGRSVLTNRPEHKIRYDLYYIKNWSLLLDIKILIRTLSVVVYQEEAY